MIERDEFLQELKEEKRLRKTVRGLLRTWLREKRTNEMGEVLEEKRLRGLIQKLIIESNSTDVASEQPHESTGINQLKKLLTNIIPTIEDDYKTLTSDKAQRNSFRAHILNAIQNSLEPVEVLATADDAPTEELAEAEDDITVKTVSDEEKFIPVRDHDQEEEAEVESFSTIEGMDETGRNFAANTYNKIEKQILSTYESLASEEDRDKFYDYLLTNLKLYFDKFEDELKTVVPEP